MWRWVIELAQEGVLLLEEMGQQARQKLHDGQYDTCCEQLRALNERGCDDAVRLGKELALLKQSNGARGWIADVLRMGLTEARACKMVAIFWFSHHCPLIYSKAKYLGVDAVARIARNIDRILQQLKDCLVARPGGNQVPVENLTHDEYRDHVKSLLPYHRRSRWERSWGHAESLRGSVLRLARGDVPPDQSLADLACRLAAAQAHLAALS
jgi:hypothetical protein